MTHYGTTTVLTQTLIQATYDVVTTSRWTFLSLMLMKIGTVISCQLLIVEEQHQIYLLCENDEELQRQIQK